MVVEIESAQGLRTLSVAIPRSDALVSDAMVGLFQHYPSPDHRSPTAKMRNLARLAFARAVQAVAAGRARDRDMEHAACRLRLPGRVVRRWNSEGLDLIARGLVGDRVRIF
jgi:hypothetical protein